MKDIEILKAIYERAGVDLTLKELAEISDILQKVDIERKLEAEAKSIDSTFQKEQGGITKAIKDCTYGNYNIHGLGPDAKVVTNEHGGSQSANPYAFECLPPLALARTAKVFAEGKRKYGRNNWINIKDPLDHIGKTIGHITAYLAGDCQEGTPDEHLGHAMCRLMFALDLIERAEQSRSFSDTNQKAATSGSKYNYRSDQEG